MQLYAKLAPSIYRHACQKMKLRIFAVILVPVQKERRVTEDSLGTLSDIISLYNPSDRYDDSITLNMKKLQNDVPNRNKHRFMANYLSKFSLFTRLSEKVLEKKYLPKITFETKEKGQQVMLRSDNEVYIVLNGKVVLREHKMHDPLDFSVAQVVKQGQIIGEPSLDMGKSSLPFVWGVVYSHSANLARMDRSLFNEMWQETRDRDREVALS